MLLSNPGARHCFAQLPVSMFDVRTTECVKPKDQRACTRVERAGCCELACVTRCARLPSVRCGVSFFFDDRSVAAKKQYLTSKIEERGQLILHLLYSSRISLGEGPASASSIDHGEPRSEHADGVVGLSTLP